jgi:hypothetical protein
LTEEADCGGAVKRRASLLFRHCERSEAIQS